MLHSNQECIQFDKQQNNKLAKCTTIGGENHQRILAESRSRRVDPSPQSSQNMRMTHKTINLTKKSNKEKYKKPKRNYCQADVMK